MSLIPVLQAQVIFIINNHLVSNINLTVSKVTTPWFSRYRALRRKSCGTFAKSLIANFRWHVPVKNFEHLLTFSRDMDKSLEISHVS